MLAETKDFVSKCGVFLSHRAEQPKEPLQPRNLFVRPQSIVGADLRDFDNRILLVIVDYYSNFIEVCNVTDSPNSRKVILALPQVPDVLARYGIPDILASDNVPQ